MCGQCAGIIQDGVDHSCIQGLTENIHRVHHNLNLVLNKLNEQPNVTVYLVVNRTLSNIAESLLGIFVTEAEAWECREKTGGLKSVVDVILFDTKRQYFEAI
jgi:hypothetical protein